LGKSGNVRFTFSFSLDQIVKENQCWSTPYPQRSPHKKFILIPERKSSNQTEALAPINNSLPLDGRKARL